MKYYRNRPLATYIAIIILATTSVISIFYIFSGETTNDKVIIHQFERSGKYITFNVSAYIEGNDIRLTNPFLVILKNESFDPSLNTIPKNYNSEKLIKCKYRSQNSKLKSYKYEINTIYTDKENIRGICADPLQRCMVRYKIDDDYYLQVVLPQSSPCAWDGFVQDILSELLKNGSAAEMFSGVKDE